MPVGPLHPFYPDDATGKVRVVLQEPIRVYCFHGEKRVELPLPLPERAIFERERALQHTYTQLARVLAPVEALRSAFLHTDGFLSPLQEAHLNDLEAILQRKTKKTKR